MTQLILIAIHTFSSSICSQITQTTTTMPHFLKLPREIRDMIYDYCLLVQGEIIPYPTYYEKEEIGRPLPQKPDIALLQVNKQIRAEAADMLYGQHVWRLSYNSTEDSMWNSSTEFIRKVVVNFDAQDLVSSALITMTRLENGQEGAPLTKFGDVCHNAGCVELVEKIWSWKIGMIAKMTKLTDLTLDFTNCSCPHGCCRLEKALGWGLTRPWRNPSFKPAVKIIGERRGAEGGAIIEKKCTCKG